MRHAMARREPRRGGEIIDFAGTLLPFELHAIRQTSRQKSKKGIKLALDHGLL